VIYFKGRLDYPTTFLLLTVGYTGILQIFEQFCPKAGDANPLFAEPETILNAK